MGKAIKTKTKRPKEKIIEVPKCNKYVVINTSDEEVIKRILSYCKD